MKVVRYNYKEQLGEGTSELMADLRQMIESGRYILSEEVNTFESQFGQYIGVDYVSGVNTGTDALLIALLALGIGRGDEVVTQANTFNATVAAICLVGAIPVLVDAEDKGFLMNQDQLDAVITGRTKAIIPVHLFGKPTPMEYILHLAEMNGISVVEDSAQAHGARIAGRMAGSFGTLSCFSFHPSKNLAAAGDAGALVTKDRALYQRIQRIRTLGQAQQNCHVTLGINSKLDSIQARILSHKLPRLDRWNAQRRQAAAWYKERLEGLPVSFQSTDDGEEHVYHLFQIRTDQRDSLLDFLLSCGIDATIRYPQPIHLQPAFADMRWRTGQFPVSESLARELLCLPIRPDLPLEEVEYVSDCVRRFFKE